MKEVTGGAKEEENSKEVPPFRTKGIPLLRGVAAPKATSKENQEPLLQVVIHRP